MVKVVVVMMMVKEVVVVLDCDGDDGGAHISHSLPHTPTLSPTHITSPLSQTPLPPTKQNLPAILLQCMDNLHDTCLVEH